jgi:hypothetical protein
VRLTFFWPKALARIERYDVRRSDGRTSQPFYHPVLRFETASGQPVVTISSFGSWRRPWNRGDTVTVHYHPAEPHWAEIATIFNIWGMPLTFLSLAIWTLLAGYWMTMP